MLQGSTSNLTYTFIFRTAGKITAAAVSAGENVWQVDEEGSEVLQTDGVKISISIS